MIKRHFHFVFLSSLSLLLLGTTNFAAQYAKPPDTYSIIYTNSMMMPNQQVKLYRDGKQVVTEEVTPRSGAMTHATHTRDYLNLDNHQDFTLDLNDASIPCGISTQGGNPGNWGGNPFEWYSGMFGDDGPKMTPAGTDSVAGLKANVLQATGPGGQIIKVWLDQKYGLMLKMAGADQGGQLKSTLEVTQISFSQPPASIFALPASCAKAEAQAQAQAAEAAAKVVTTDHKVTAVHLDTSPEYTGACPAVAHFTGTITADGPGVAWYRITGGFGNHGVEGTVKFDEAGTKSISQSMVVNTDPEPGGGSALLESAMEDSQGRHGDATATANGDFSFACHAPAGKHTP